MKSLFFIKYEMEAKVTLHGQQRIKDRVGVSKKIADKIAQKALEKGIKHNEVAGSLKRYLDGLYLLHKNANNIRIYNRKVYLFHNETLITVLNLPSDFFKTIDKIKRKRKE